MIKKLVKKEKASSEYIIPIMVLMVVMIIILFKMQLSTVSQARIKVEDSMTDANMASALIDNEDRSTTHYTGNRDIEDNPEDILTLYSIYINCLATELSLDDIENMTPVNSTLITGKVEVLEYSIYNYYEDHIAKITYYPQSGEIETDLNLPVDTNTPNGEEINAYTVYSKIGFHLNNVPLNRWGSWLSKSGKITQDELDNLAEPVYVEKDNAVQVYDFFDKTYKLK